MPDVLNALADMAHIVAEHCTGTVVALTGSAGKTTTKDNLKTILSLEGSTVANHRSFNNQIDFPVTVSRVEPDSRYLVLEMAPAARATSRHCATPRSQPPPSSSESAPHT
ncbi:Mur ligase family protein [Streptomyces sp. NPDC008061]|uniref:Mur ligase family protein n=1 Tax=Streptomyces sp. NPDC008061 TaxID=3364805 RepID=UPI0036EE006B